MPTAPKTYRAGSLAYWDTFAGLVPCKVSEVHPSGEVTFRVTAPRGPYKRGETHTRPGHWVPPRSHIRSRGESLRIVGGYVWKPGLTAPDSQPPL